MMAKCKRSVITSADASTANARKPSPSLEGVNDFDAAPPHVDKHRAGVAAGAADDDDGVDGYYLLL